FAWSAEEFEARLAGSPIRRIGHESWLRNLAVALGNSRGGPLVLAALRARADDVSPVVREHVAWALDRLSQAAAERGNGLAGAGSGDNAGSPTEVDTDRGRESAPSGGTVFPCAPRK